MHINTLNFRLLAFFTIISVVGMIFYFNNGLDGCTKFCKDEYIKDFSVPNPGSEGFSDHKVSTKSQFKLVKSTSNLKENRIIIYNRVPKTGSTSLMGLAYDLCGPNHFNVIHINTSKNSHVLSLPDQAFLVENITSWSEKKPAIYHGHIAFLNFDRFGVQEKPIYINLIREPLERLVSHYYFLRYGDDFRPYVVRRRQGNRVSFDQCVKNKNRDCDPSNMWLQVPFFCGHVSDCWKPENEWALQEAKRNLVQNYLVVGVTQQLHEFVAVLEFTQPNFYKGALQKYEQGKKSHLRKTNNKTEPLEETKAIIKESKIWQMENDFYQFALQQFNFLKQRHLIPNGNTFVNKGRQFFYEKIRPR